MLSNRINLTWIIRECVKCVSDKMQLQFRRLATHQRRPSQTCEVDFNKTLHMQTRPIIPVHFHGFIFEWLLSLLVHRLSRPSRATGIIYMCSFVDYRLVIVCPISTGAANVNALLIGEYLSFEFSTRPKKLLVARYAALRSALAIPTVENISKIWGR